MKIHLLPSLSAFLLFTACELMTPSFMKDLDNPVDPESPSYIAPAPTGVNAFAGDGSITLTWTAGKGVDSYNVYWGTAAGVTKAGESPISAEVSGLPSKATTVLPDTTPPLATLR